MSNLQVERYLAQLQALIVGPVERTDALMPRSDTDICAYACRHQALMTDALILAKASGHDVFNALDCLQNQEILKVPPHVCCRSLQPDASDAITWAPTPLRPDSGVPARTISAATDSIHCHMSRLRSY